MNKYNIVFHLGFSKTGTTFLQKNVFPYLQNVKFFGNDEFRISSNLSKTKINLVSDETFSNDYLWFDTDNRIEVAERIYRLFPYAKIILFIRDVEDFKHSMYNEYIIWGGNLSYDRWVSWCKFSNPDIFDFDKYIKFLQSLFKEVMIVDYNDFKDNNQMVIRKICGFIGTLTPMFDKHPLNISFDEKIINRWRRFNRFFYNRFQPILPGINRYFNPLTYYRFLIRRFHR